MFGKNLGATARGRNLRIERLENKTLLAGDVHVVVADGDLRITGDDQDNHIQVVATLDVGEYRVLGVDRSGNPTAINGELGQIRVSGVTDDIRIDMGGGDSRVALLNGELLDGASGGEGDIRELVVPDDLIIHNRSGRLDRTGKPDRSGRSDRSDPTDHSGRLEVFTENVRVRDDLVIYTEDGYDDIALLETLVGDNLYISTHGGGDDVLLRDVGVNDKAIIKLGEGENFASVDDTLVRNLLCVMGGHAQDTIQIRDTLVHDEIRIHSHAGNDDVCLLDVDAQRMQVDLGSGNDRLDLRRVDIDLYTHLNGGAGFDTVGADHDDNSLHGLVAWNFEDREAFVNCFREVELEPEPEPEPEPEL